MDTAAVTVGGAILAAVISAAVAWVTAMRTVKSEHAKRQSELALKISELVSSKDETIRKAAMRRFAVAIFKISAPDSAPKHKEEGVVHFIPMNSRVTVGRDEDNDITLEVQDRSLSRWHCGFISDRDAVWIDDYRSLNGTHVNGKAISTPCLLKDADEITVGRFKMTFRYVGKNSILSR